LVWLLTGQADFRKETAIACLRDRRNTLEKFSVYQKDLVKQAKLAEKAAADAAGADSNNPLISRDTPTGTGGSLDRPGDVSRSSSAGQNPANWAADVGEFKFGL